MALQPDLPINRLPQEVLLNVAERLLATSPTKDLANFSRVSKRLRPAAQDVLHSLVRLPGYCLGTLNKQNHSLKFLRTTLSRPDLAAKVRSLSFVVARKDISACKENSFDLTDLRTKCQSRLSDLQFNKQHLWWQSLENSIESAFVGVLLTLLPNLKNLSSTIKNRDDRTLDLECLSALFGTIVPPEAAINCIKRVNKLEIGDLQLLKCGIDFNSLTHLEIQMINAATLVRLSGPNCLQGTTNLRSLILGASLQLMDKLLMKEVGVELSHLFEALKCTHLEKLSIEFGVVGPYYTEDELIDSINAEFIFNQLQSVEKTLIELEMTLQIMQDENEMEEILESTHSHKTSLQNFVSLKKLTVPQSFLFSTDAPTLIPCSPQNLPPELEHLELLYPHELVEEWVLGFQDEESGPKLAPRNLRGITLRCRNELVTSASTFTEHVGDVWRELSEHLSIETIVYDEVNGTREDLACLHRLQEDSEAWTDTDNEHVQEWDGPDDFHGMRENIAYLHHLQEDAEAWTDTDDEHEQERDEHENDESVED